MTMPASARQFGDRLPSVSERTAANQLRRVIAAHATNDAKLGVVDAETKIQTEIVLTPALSGLLTELLRHIGNGDAVRLVPVSNMLTTQQAADILNVSRPFFISLLDKKAIEYTHVGRHRRILAEDLFRFKRDREVSRGAALSALAELDAELL